MIRTWTIAENVWREILRRKDVYVLLILLGALLVTLVSLDVFGLDGLVRYVADVGFLMAWLFAWILSINVAARELPQEESRGTIFPLLAKPVTRLEVLLGKWLGVTSIVMAATVVFYAAVCGVVLARGGFLDPMTLLQALLLHGMAIGIMTAVAILFSTRMNHDAAATLGYILTGASFAVVPRVPAFLARESGFNAGMLLFLYNALPHFEVFDLRRRLVHNYGPVEWRVVGLVALYGLALTAAFLLLAWLAYRNKRFSRGSLAA